MSPLELEARRRAKSSGETNGVGEGENDAHSDRAALLDALLADPLKAVEVPRDVAIPLLVELARVQRALELLAVSAAPVAKAAPRLLTLPEVAERSRKSLRWWREHWRAELGGVAIRKGRTVLIPEDGLDRWLKRT
jgi:hypothetical protein